MSRTYEYRLRPQSDWKDVEWDGLSPVISLEYACDEVTAMLGDQAWTFRRRDLLEFPRCVVGLDLYTFAETLRVWPWVAHMLYGQHRVKDECDGNKSKLQDVPERKPERQICCQGLWLEDWE